MSTSVIQVENLSKLYRIGEVSTGTLSHDLNRWWHKVRGKDDPYLKVGQVNELTRKASSRFSNPSSEYVYALQDINFTVNQGEVLGIIGRNGAGKSTFLKILSRVTSPSSGCIKVKGRIASLLEVGTGFHPDLTGRENIYLNGAILGMTKSEIRKKFDEIVAFAEVEKFLDTSVKRYSSGMYVRLAFAVAAHLEPEILIVDEVLAVGDAQFQAKCLGKMGEVARGGRTVLFVSHNIGAVATLCTRGLYLKSGKLVLTGNTQDAILAYLAQTSQQSYQVCFEEDDACAGDSTVRVREARIIGPAGKPQGTISVGEAACVEIIYDLLQNSFYPKVNLHFSTEHGDYAFASIDSTPHPGKKGRYKCRMHLPPDFLNGKTYVISIYVSSFQPATHVHVELKDALLLCVTDEMNSITRHTYKGAFPGAVRPILQWDSVME